MDKDSLYRCTVIVSHFGVFLRVSDMASRGFSATAKLLVSLVISGIRILYIGWFSDETSMWESGISVTVTYD